MTWLYLPPDAIKHAMAGGACADFPSAPEPVVSTSASTSPSPPIELFVMSSGTPTPRLLSWPGWKMRPWIAHLSGTTLPPSTAARGAAQWISFMAAIRASRSASPDDNWETKTQDICGRTSPALWEKSNHLYVSSKMSADIYDWGSNKSTMTFDAWVTALRRACSQRRKSALHTDANDCLSWLTPRAQESSERQDTFLKRNGDRTDRCVGSLTTQTAMWPTATATDGNKGGPNSRHGNGSPHLPSAAIQAQWYTPNVPNGGRVNPKEMSPTGKMPNGTKRQVGLENQALQIWPTPRASQNENNQTKPTPSQMKGEHGLNLAMVAVTHTWPTPMANPNSNRQTKPTPSQLKGEHGLNLAMVAVTQTWPTPRACSGKRSSGSNRTELVRSWATPQSSDYRDRGTLSDPCIQKRVSEGRQINLSMMAHPSNFQYGRPSPEGTNNGRPSRPTLNPPFVEWLMGWPIGWTDCGSAVTELSRWLQLMRSELSRLLLASTNEQMDLFS